MKESIRKSAIEVGADVALRRFGPVCLGVAALLIGACTSAPKCDELAFYETAAGGKRIEAPEGLDPLDANREFVIPEASPRPPRDLTAGCLDRPPTLKTD